MADRDDQFLSLYQECRFKDQQNWYKNRQAEFETAHSQAITLTTWLMFFASVTSTLAAASGLVGWKQGWAVLAVVFPVLSTAISAYNELYAFERQANLYKDAANALLAARADMPDPKVRLTDDRAPLITYVNQVEDVFRREQGQWGQLMADLKLFEKPLEAPKKLNDKSQGQATPPGGSGSAGAA